MAERRNASSKKKLLVMASIFFLGPLGLLMSSFMVKKVNNVAANSFSGRLAWYKEKIDESEKKVQKLEQRLDTPLGRLRSVKINQQIDVLNKEIDSLYVQRASIYNPAISLLDDPVNSAKELTKIHDFHGQNMQLDEKEKEKRIQNIRSTYVSLSERGRDKVQEHISKLKI